LWTYHTSLAHQQEWEHVWTWRLPGGRGEQVYDWDTSVHAVWDSRTQWVDPDGGGPWQHWVAGFPQFVPAQALKAHSAAGAVVWEPFLGGGTTLLACETLGRRCLGSDQDPGAIAVTLQRFSDATGERPRRVT
jgi:DNA modification methylase